jgi:hypothetical protein
LPDETVSAALLPLYPSSGLVSTYAANVADPIHDPLRTVYPVAGGPQGYSISPADVFLSSTGTPLVPWPMNRGVDADHKAYYTWRDTSLQVRAGANGGGIEMPIVNIAQGTSIPATYAAGDVPTFGLPLLMEFRCYPDSAALGLNALDVSLATASSPQPNMRAFSTGGVNSSGSVVTINPDLQMVATGGFNPSSTPPGATTLPVDNVFHIGQLDLVTRISRAHFVWIDTLSAASRLVAPVIDPPASEQPAGTSVSLHFRQASSVANVNLLRDAGSLDAYGDRAVGSPGTDPTFIAGDRTWKASVAGLPAAQFFQTRITFVSNAETGRVPPVSGLGLAWNQD